MGIKNKLNSTTVFLKKCLYNKLKDPATAVNNEKLQAMQL